MVIKSVLVANRGEIAVRVMVTAKRLGIRTIAVYSEADANALHVQVADTAVCIGQAAASKSYLSIDNIISAAKDTGADAIHPGYGFLSENAALVDACHAAGITFIGPSSDAMRAMGLKDAAKKRMVEAGVPVVPGYHDEDQDDAVLSLAANEVGYPILIKARSGGGGKGMRRVDSAEDFHDALTSARREAQQSFGDDSMLIEKFIANPRHIEVQVFGDTHGNVVHLYERDCSLQRRHQKVIEEAPAPGMSNDVRKSICDAAVRAAKAINYVGAGTIEFIADGSDELNSERFWFMEMNTRLQVEHPVTEAVTGIDLVEWQFVVAQGLPIPRQQDQITLTGHAVEARLYAEDAKAGFLPVTGRLLMCDLDASQRVDTGVRTGDDISPHYDPMLAKLISHGADRDAAFQGLSNQLARSTLLGTTSNREYLWRLVDHPRVRGAAFDTSFIETHHDELVMVPDAIQLALLAIAAMTVTDQLTVGGRTQEPFATLGHWQLWGSPSRPLRLIVDGDAQNFYLRKLEARQWALRLPDGTTVMLREEQGRFSVDGSAASPAQAVRTDTMVHVQYAGWDQSFGLPVVGAEANDQGNASGLVKAPMPGKVIALEVAMGDEISAGQALLTLEAMKMEHVLTAPHDGRVAEMGIGVDSQVAAGQLLLSIEEC